MNNMNDPAVSFQLDAPNELPGLRHSFQSESNVGRQFDSTPISLLKRRITGQVVKMRPVAEDPQRPQWSPGAEPGLNPEKEFGGRADLPIVHRECEITVVDFSSGMIQKRDLTNNTLLDFLQRGPQYDPEEHCRWINVHGLSWDVIQMLGQHYHLSALPLEDLLNERTRTKAEWYTDQLFIVLKLQRLMEIETEDLSRASTETKASKTATAEPVEASGGSKLHQALFGGQRSPTLPLYTSNERSNTKVNQLPYRTLQRYHGGEIDERVDFMEAWSPLRHDDLEILVEQVSIFVTSSNVIISFFESPAKEIEDPIMRRLNTASTVIRRAADATMVAQGLIDVIADLALPVVGAFKNTIDKMEISVLTKKPDRKDTTLFYVLKSEMLASKNLLNPVTRMIQQLRSHKRITLAAHNGKPIPSSTVTISDETDIYFGDVEDHCIMMEASVDQMLNSCRELNDLIFNTLNIDTNSTMKRLTFVTIGFFPLTFLTGYFGMNFHKFTGINNSDAFFWALAVPLTAFAFAMLNMDSIQTYLARRGQRKSLDKLKLLRERRNKQRSLERLPNQGQGHPAAW